MPWIRIAFLVPLESLGYARFSCYIPGMSYAKCSVSPLVPTDNRITKPCRDPQPMSSAQRCCLLRVLKNAASCLIGTINLLENEDASPTPAQIATCLKSVPSVVSRAVTALKKGSFCTLSEEECAFVGQHLGCKRSCPLKS